MWGRVELYTGILVGKPDRMRPLGRPRHRWEDNIKMEIFRKWDLKARTGLMWFRIGTGDGHL